MWSFSYTCAYLACKVEEFNVSIMQFVSNLKGDRAKMADIILAHELLLMQQLHYHLTIHNPFRPLEGLLIDIKVAKLSVCLSHLGCDLVPAQERTVPLRPRHRLLYITAVYHFVFQTRFSDIGDVERLRPGAEDFIDRSFHSDVGLIFAPSQVRDINQLNSRHLFCFWDCEDPICLCFNTSVFCFRLLWLLYFTVEAKMHLILIGQFSHVAPVFGHV